MAIRGAIKGSFDLYQRDGIWYIGTIRRSTGTADKKEAQRIRDAVVGQIRSGKWRERERYKQYTFSMLVDRFMSEHAPTVSAGGQRFYKQCLTNHITPYFGRYTLSEIGQAEIWSFKIHRRKSGNSASTINRDLAVLSKMFNLAVLWDWIKANPIKKGLKEKVPPVRHGKPLSLTDEITLLVECRAGNYLSGDLADILTLGIYTGMRSGALLALTWSQVDF
ncbi:MAG: phage integrase family protein [Nitrospirae bacterium]|nr:MAG: phage integrase family protein [Nitrospirota bacterium]